MGKFKSNNFTLNYIEEGDGEPIVLIHGFASSIQRNWVDTGWFSTLVKAGRRVIAFDNRGHGQSDKPYILEAYEAPNMAEDVVALLDHLDLEKADIMGYSMGGRITAFTGLKHPNRIRSAILGGIGTNLIKGTVGSDGIAEALEAESIDEVTHPVGKLFRRFAESGGNDLKALATCMRSGRPPLHPDDFSNWQIPTLIVVGDKDDVAGSGEELGACIPGSEVVILPNRDHMLAVGDKTYKASVIDFVDRRP